MNLSKIKLEHVTSPKKWKNFIVGMYRTFKFGAFGAKQYSTLYTAIMKADMPVHYKEQVLWRATQCSDCLLNGSCLHCGCEMPGKFLDETDECDQNKWGPMMVSPVWDMFKEDNNVQL